MDDLDLDVRREALIADLERLAIGRTPDVAILAAAPRIEQWSVVYYPGTRDLALHGIVSGHPRIPNGPMTTSPVMATGLPQRWVRTHSRFYVLGKCAACEVDRDGTSASETVDD